MKYVIVKVELAGVERVFPFCFPERLTHATVAVRACRAVTDEFEEHAEVYSAGFCFLGDECYTDVECGSESLKIQKNEKQSFMDMRILNQREAMQGAMPC